MSEPNSGLIVLNVRKDNVPVLRAHVELSDAEPTRWSVVRWEEGQRGHRRASEEKLGPMYVVCPECAERARVTPDVRRLKCPDCGGEFDVDWEHPC